MEGEMYKKQLQDVRQSTTLPAWTKMVGRELYSDKTVVSQPVGRSTGASSQHNNKYH